MIEAIGANPCERCTDRLGYPRWLPRAQPHHVSPRSVLGAAWTLSRSDPRRTEAQRCGQLREMATGHFAQLLECRCRSTRALEHTREVRQRRDRGTEVIRVQTFDGLQCALDRARAPAEVPQHARQPGLGPRTAAASDGAASARRWERQPSGW